MYEWCGVGEESIRESGEDLGSTWRISSEVQARKRVCEGFSSETKYSEAE